MPDSKADDPRTSTWLLMQARACHSSSADFRKAAQCIEDDDDNQIEALLTDIVSVILSLQAATYHVAVQIALTRESEQEKAGPDAR